MKAHLFFALAIALAISGCISEPQLGEPVPPEPAVTPPVVENLPPIVNEPPPEPIAPKDQCEWTLSIENFKYEAKPAAVQAREYTSCYNDKYILRVTPSTEASFCNEIVDDSFLINCYVTVAKKTGQISACSAAPQKIVSIPENQQEITLADACYYQYLATFSSVISDEEETALCNSVLDEKFKEYCFKRLDYFKNR